MSRASRTVCAGGWLLCLLAGCAASNVAGLLFLQKNGPGGDQVVFFTDGVIEARSPDGNFFGADRLADLVGRASAGGNPPPETLRRLVHSILDHQAGDLQDDATAVLVEWKGQGKESLEV